MQVNSQIEVLLARYAREYSDFDGLTLADVNQHGYGEDVPIHIAARHGLLGDIRLLVEAGARINELGDLGFTSLRYAAMMGQVDAVKLLVELGANTQARNEYGQTPLVVARLGDHNDVVQFLQTL